MSIHALRPLTFAGALRELSVFLIAGGFAACTPVATAPEPTREVDVFADLPLIQPVSQTVEMQRQGGVTITVAPTHFDTVGRTACVYQFPPTSLFSITTTPNGATFQTHQRFVEVQYHDIDATPPGLAFLVTIKNGMSRVFRGAGAVVQFNVDSHILAVEQSSYVEFLNVLIPPNNEAQVTISGPTLASLRDGATFGVFLYDVVTAIDNAGNVTKRDNFEWYFRVNRQRVSLKSSLVPTYVWVPRQFVPRIAQAVPGGTQTLINQDRCMPGVVAEGQRGSPVARPAGPTQPATSSSPTTPAPQTASPTAEPRAVPPPKAAVHSDYRTSLDSGLAALRAGRNADATRLLEAAHRENPRHRDVLLNLSRLYVADGAHGRAIATAKQLIAIDACSPDSYEILGDAYRSLNRGLEARKQTGVSARDSLKWSADSATKYERRKAALPVAVSFSSFSPSSTHVDVAGSVTNKSTASHSLTIFLSFIDARGATVAADTIRTGPLAPKATKEIKSSRAVSGAAAFSCRMS